MTRALESRYESADNSPGFMLWRVTNQWQAAIRRALEPFGVTHVQFVLLANLTWSQEEAGVTQAELSHRARADPMMVSQVLRALEKRDLVQRTPDPVDRRAIRVRATVTGMATARAANHAVEGVDVRFFSASTATARPFIEHLIDLDSHASTAPTSAEEEHR